MSQFENKQDKIEHRYDYLNILPASSGGYTVKSVDNEGYPPHSVLAGQPIIRFVDSCDTLEEAQAKYPDAQLSHDMMMPKNTFDHLPDGPDEDYDDGYDDY